MIVAVVAQRASPSSGLVLGRLARHRLGRIGLGVVAAYLLIAALAPWLGPYDPNAVDLRNVMKPPSAVHWFGTDQFGRDLLTRTIYGARTSLLLGLCVVTAATLVGVAIGTLAGFYRGRIEAAVTFATDVLMTLPSIVVALGIITILGSGLVSTIVAIAISAVPRLVRVARGSVLQVRELDFVDGARSLGVGDPGLIWRHILPNAMSPVIVQASLLIAESILVAAGLAFLGLGVAPPIAEWGQMLAEGRAYLRAAPFISVFPGLALAVLVLGLNLLGDGLRDALDVRIR